MTRSTTLLVLCLALTIVAAPTMAVGPDKGSGEEEPKEKANRPAGQTKPSPFMMATGGKSGESATKVYGNADLEKMFGPVPASAAPAAAGQPGGDAAAPSGAATPPSALDQLFASKAAGEEHAQRVAEGEQAVASARERIAEIEKRALAVKNPYLARPKAPTEGAEQWQTMNAQQRVEQTEKDLAAAREALAQAERELAALRAGAP